MNIPYRVMRPGPYFSKRGLSSKIHHIRNKYNLSPHILTSATANVKLHHYNLTQF